MQRHAMLTAARKRLTDARDQLTMAQVEVALHRRTAYEHQRAIRRTDRRLAQFRTEQPLLPAGYSSNGIEAAVRKRSNLQHRLQDETALTAAYEVVATAHRLALGAASREVHLLNEYGTKIAPANPMAHAVNYTATYATAPDGAPIEYPGALSADRVESVLRTWQRVPQARILVDQYSRYTVSMPDGYIELRPVDAPTPNEGDVLQAALRAYGLPSYPTSKCGITYRMVPLDIAATGAAVHTGPHLLVASGEHADHPIDAHDEPWTIALHHANGDPVRTLYTGSRLPGGVAEESARCAKFAASWIRTNALTHLPSS